MLIGRHVRSITIWPSALHIFLSQACVVYFKKAPGIERGTGEILVPLSVAAIIYFHVVLCRPSPYSTCSGVDSAAEWEVLGPLCSVIGSGVRSVIGSGVGICSVKH